MKECDECEILEQKATEALSLQRLTDAQSVLIDKQVAKIAELEEKLGKRENLITRYMNKFKQQNNKIAELESLNIKLEKICDDYLARMDKLGNARFRLTKALKQRRDLANSVAAELKTVLFRHPFLVNKDKTISTQIKRLTEVIVDDVDN